jgi:tetratricopeptide (TPR) repeat protein
LGEYKKAIDLLHSYPDWSSNYFACAGLGYFSMKNNQPFDAIFYYEKAIKMHSKEGKIEELLHSLYRLYIQTNNKTKSDEVLSSIRNIQPDFNPVIEQKLNSSDDESIKAKELIEDARKLIRINKNDEALSLLLESVQIQESVLANRVIGSIYLSKKIYDKAIIFLEKAYATDPKDPSTLNNLFIAHLRQKNFKSADRFLKEFKTVSSDDKRVKDLQILFDNAINEQ